MKNIRKRLLGNAVAPIETGPIIERQQTLDVELKSIFKDTLFFKWNNKLVILSWVFFIVYEIAMYLNYQFNENPLCPYNADDFPIYYLCTGYATLGGFIVIWLTMFTKLYQSTLEEARIPFTFSFHIVSLGMISNFLAITFSSGGICIDQLNVATSASIWGEWLSCGPLLVFMATTINKKRFLRNTDLMFIISAFLNIVFGFLIIPKQSKGLALFWLLSLIHI